MIFRKVFELLKKSFLQLTFPAKCIHCFTLLPPETIVLCPACSSLLELINPDDCCPICFNLSRDDHVLCHDCLQYPSLFSRMGAAFVYNGVAATLIKRLKYSNQPYLAKGMGAFLFAQFDRLQWPLPDVIIPVPISRLRLFERGYNQSALLAEELGRFLQRPVWNVLKRLSGDYSQAGLLFEQRKTLEAKRFRMNIKYELAGKILLVIDDVMTTGTTLACCGEILSECHPASIYALTFCRTQFS